MTSLKVYYDLLSQPSRALILFLKINNIPYQSCPIALRKGEHFSGEYARINPFQRVPAIVDGDFKLTESIAILRYLSSTRNIDDHWYPKETKLQARVDEFLEWQHLDVRANCARYFQIKPLITGIPAKPERVKDFQTRMEKSLDDIENIWLQKGSKKYLAGDKISVADIWGACELEQPKMAGYDVKSKRPVLSKWLEDVRNELNPHYDEVHLYVNKMIEKYGGVAPVKAKM